MAAVVGLKQPLGEPEDCIQRFSKKQACQIFYGVCTTPVFVSVTFNADYLAHVGPSIPPKSSVDLLLLAHFLKVA